MDCLKRILNPVSLGQCVSCKRAPIKHVCSGCLLVGYCNNPGCQDNHYTNASQHLKDCAVIQSLLFINGNGDGQKPLQKTRKTRKEPEDLNVVDWSKLNKDVLSIILGFLSFEEARNLSLTDKETLRKIRNNYMLNTIWKINPVVFFQDINGNGSWKRNIRRIQLVDDFNRPLDLRLVPKLTSLNLGYSFNQELNLKHVTNLTTLDLGAHFNQPLNLEHVTNLTSLYLGWDFNQELNLEHVTNLTSLHLGHDFKQPMNLEHVRNLTTLRLGWDFNQELNLEPVPNLTSLHLGVNFNQAIRVRNGVVVHYSKGYQRNLVTFY